MSTTSRRRRAAALGLALAATLATMPGCGSSSLIWVTGKVVKGGAPFSCPPDRKLGVTLIAVEVRDASGKDVANDEPYAAQVNPADGTFVVPGPDGRGIPPGRYRVALTQKPTAAAVWEAQAKAGKNAKAIKRDTDDFKNRYGAANSPIVRVLESSCELTIDLDRPVVSQNN